jgi:CRISPR-associated endoribonuclease Cas6
LYDGASGDERLLCSATIHRGIERMAVIRGDVKTVTLEFLTPTRLRYVGHLTDKPEFHVLVRNLLRRLSALAFYHCDFVLELDHRELIRQAQRVALREAELRWVDWERYSARQDARMTLGGFMGTVTFEGNLAPWLPLLRLGEVLHVGKGSGFGLGKYRMIDES